MKRTAIIFFALLAAIIAGAPESFAQAESNRQERNFITEGTNFITRGATGPRF